MGVLKSTYRYLKSIQLEAPTKLGNTTDLSTRANKGFATNTR
jgi:hypothetical protein